MSADLRDLAATEDWEALLSDTERRLVEHAASGETLDLGPDDPGTEPVDIGDTWDDVRLVRGRVLEVLLLGERNDWPLHHGGLVVAGARIIGEVNLSFGTIDAPVGFQDCVFEQPVAMTGATLETLAMTGTRIRELTADGIEVSGDVFLREGFATTGEVRLIGAKIGGDLDCTGGSFTSQSGYALTADRVNIAGSVYFQDGFTATGHVSLISTRVGGNLNCVGWSFAKPQIEPHSMPLTEETVTGQIDLRGALVGLLVDEVDTWPNGWHGDGFTFRDFGSDASVDVGERLTWLKQQDGGFRPGPYSKLAAVYRRRGDPEAARKVLIARERLRTDELTSWRQTRHRVWGFLSRYGYQPWRAIFGLLVLIGVSAVVFWRADALGDMAPLVAESKRVVFYPLVYAADLAIPLVDLRQAADYQPEERWAQWCMWGTIALGWFLSGAFLAAVTGIFKPDE